MKQNIVKTLCTCCTACSSACPKNCITIMKDENSFPFPHIDISVCINCGLCEKVCPVLHPEDFRHEPAAFAAYSRDDDIRMSSSSGGVFTELAGEILAQGGAVYGAAYDEKFHVHHICVENKKDLFRLRGAKYAQSDLDGIFRHIKNHLDNGRQILFSGTPCQTAGLKAFLQRKYENLITVDFICHSVPSPAAWQAYVKYRAQKDYNGILPVSINLRSKITGWSRYRYANLFSYPDGTTCSIPNGESLYMKLFVNGYISRESCAGCLFKGYSRGSDITIGDFWGVWDIAPEMDDDRGTSVVLCQSAEGAKLLQSAAHRLVIKQITVEEAGRQNTAMQSAAVPNPKRQEALNLIRNGDFDACKAFFVPPRQSVKQKIRHVVRKIWGRQ